MSSGVYKLTSPSGKIYIGQSWNIEKRFRSYKTLDCQMQAHLYNALKLYPWSAWKKEIMFLTDSQQELDQFEISLIKLYNSTVKGYNIREGGFGGKHSEETKRKLSLAHLGKKHKPMSPAAKLNMSLARMGNTARKGSKLSEETKTKMSLATKGRIVSEETKAKISAARKAYIARLEGQKWS